MEIPIEDIKIGSDSNQFYLASSSALKVYEQFIKAGKMSVNNARTRLGLQHLPGADNIYVPVETA